MSAVPARAYMTIGEVLTRLRPEFPDVTVSKIRFLESEGLIEPGRTAAGYRKFTYADVERLRYVLRSQRDHYLPLRVIRENLDSMDEEDRDGRPGGDSARPGSESRPPRLLSLAGSAEDPGATDAAAGETQQPDVRLSRQELLDSSGLTDGHLDQLETYGMIRPRGVGRAPYDAAALRVATVAAELAGFGLEPRHLRGAKNAADREVGLVEQVVAPLLRQHDGTAQARAEETAREIAALSAKLHTALVDSELNAWLGR